MELNLFKEMWAIQYGSREEFSKSQALTKHELMEVQRTIASMQKRSLPAEKIIAALQKEQNKLREKWKAERAYYTEVKRQDTNKVGEAGEELDFDKYRVILSPHACKTCREKTENGRKMFKSSDLEKSGYGHIPPFHPNCYCILLPVE